MFTLIGVSPPSPYLSVCASACPFFPPEIKVFSILSNKVLWVTYNSKNFLHEYCAHAHRKWKAFLNNIILAARLRMRKCPGEKFLMKCGWKFSCLLHFFFLKWLYSCIHNPSQSSLQGLYIWEKLLHSSANIKVLPLCRRVIKQNAGLATAVILTHTHTLAMFVWIVNAAPLHFTTPVPLRLGQSAIILHFKPWMVHHRRGCHP